MKVDYIAEIKNCFSCALGISNIPNGCPITMLPLDPINCPNTCPLETVGEEIKIVAGIALSKNQYEDAILLNLRNPGCIHKAMALYGHTCFTCALYQFPPCDRTDESILYCKNWKAPE